MTGSQASARRARAFNRNDAEDLLYDIAGIDTEYVELTLLGSFLSNVQQHRPTYRAHTAARSFAVSRANLYEETHQPQEAAAATDRDDDIGRGQYASTNTLVAQIEREDRRRGACAATELSDFPTYESRRRRNRFYLSLYQCVPTVPFSITAQQSHSSALRWWRRPDGVVKASRTRTSGHG